MNFCVSDSRPEDNFYDFVNYKWLNVTTIPSDQQRWGTFNCLHDENLKKLNDLITTNLNSTDLEFSKVVTLYEQAMDESRNYIEPCILVTDFLKRMEAITTKEQLGDFILTQYNLYGISTPVNFMVYNDFADANMNILHLGSSGLGLPDRDYYFHKNKESIVEKYKKFMKEYMDLFGNYNTDEIYKLEKLLAEFTFTNVQKRDPLIMNNLCTIDTLDQLLPQLNTRKFLDKINVLPQKINLINPTFLEKYACYWDQLPLENWKQYYTWLYLRKMGCYINLKTESKLFNFYSKELSGTEIMKPLWKRSLSTVQEMLGMVLGKMFVEKYFSEEAKNKVIDMITFIKTELELRLKQNDWMEESTKTKALDKLNKMNFKIGYPDKWRTFEKVNVEKENSYLQNILNSMKFENDFDLTQLYNEIDRSLWFMNPQDVNAYYSPSYNEIVFPAGILQEPFFSLKYDMAVNFGGIGVVIGHEMTHGFDDQGKKYDAEGNLNDWWTANDTNRYKSKIVLLKEQFNSLMIEGEFINGELTLGENIADLGGVSIAFSSLIKYLKIHPIENKSIGGFNQQQRFFMSFANIWRCKTRREETLRRLVTDPHSPPIYRVNSILSNFDEFYKAFNVKTISKMWLDPKKRTNLW